MRTRPELFVVVAAGVALRLILIPITRGQDFVVWDLATKATLQGTNIYEHHPNYPGGPFAYFPLFVYVELPFQWLAQHTGITFTVLGKLPMLAGDLAIALLIARELTDREVGRRAAAIGAGLFFLNPLILYNSAFYGRFDSVGCALLLLAVRRIACRGRGGALWYALAVAMKTFPGFVLPAILRATGRAWIRILVVLTAVLVAVSAPYLATWHPYVHDIFLYDTQKYAQYLSWQRLLQPTLSAETARQVSYVLLGLFAFGTVALGRRMRLDLAVPLTLVLFILLSKVVLDQYLTWPLPWLILAAWTRPRRIGRASAGMVVILTSIGFLANASIHPFGRSAWWLEVGLASCCAGYLTLLVATSVRHPELRADQASPRRPPTMDPRTAR